MHPGIPSRFIRFCKFASHDNPRADLPATGDDFHHRNGRETDEAAVDPGRYDLEIQIAARSLGNNAEIVDLF